MAKDLGPFHGSAWAGNAPLIYYCKILFGTNADKHR
uniref:Uncharacterized protein n=1 Tax=Anguilla anguilla TaxID=7936 RepID=A0A0E9VKD6_ANGAN